MLQPGAPFGPYEVISLLGAGGMGEVYRARDPRLNRDVAIKVLPEALETDHERVARFAREAQTLAALSHPHIATVFGVEQQDGRHGLVMELVEGPTLADRLKAGPIDWRDAVELARQIAEAMSAAHDRGVIHRDLKPANIKLTADGSIKVLDFGLAKALDLPSGLRGQASGEFANSPTLSVLATGAGVLLGTAGYMSPEQARGTVVDRRTDVWAFGCVLFEMLTGTATFAGDTVSDTLAAVLRAEPNWTALPDDLPRGVTRVLRRCLAKDRQQRFADLHDVAIELSDARDEQPAGASSTGRPFSRWRVIGVALAVLSVVAAALTGFLVLGDRRAVPASAHTAITLPPGLRLPTAPLGSTLEFSADGNTVFFVAIDNAGRHSIYRKSFSEFDIAPVNGGSGMESVFVSPDGKWLGGHIRERVYRLPVEGGTPTVISGAEPGWYGWTHDDQLVMTSRSGPLRVMPSSGGQTTALASADGAELNGITVALKGATTLLFDAAVPGSPQTIDIRRFDPVAGTVTTITQGRSPRVVGSDLLVFWRDGALWAAPLDAAGALRGAALAVAADVSRSVLFASGPGLYAVSRNGHLAFVPAAREAPRRLVWVDRRGQVTQAFPETGSFTNPRLSSDGRHVAINETNQPVISILDLKRGTRTRLPVSGRRPIWVPDGTSLIVQGLNARGRILRQGIDGAGREVSLLAGEDTYYPDDVTPDGKTVVYNTGGFARDLWLLRDGKTQSFLTTPANERGAAISPDGKWIAYTSNESGRDEVYVQRFPDGGSRIPVSTRGGLGARWARNGREVFYREVSQLVAVPFDGTGPIMGAPNVRYDRFEPSTLRRGR
jgi:hypothetical protein